MQLQDDQGHLVSLVKSDLRKLTISTTSPMPAYGEKLTPGALADLVPIPDSERISTMTRTFRLGGGGVRRGGGRYGLARAGYRETVCFGRTRSPGTG